MAVIEVRGLTKRFGTVTAVDDLTFDVPAGTVTGVLGPNGAGKTTTLRMLLGLVTPTAGGATINGRAYGKLTDPLRTVGASLEAASFHPGRTARNHLRLMAMAGGVERARADEVLELVDLARDADRRVGGFSLGMRQRLALAASLVADPAVLILDEPANGLDPEGVRWLRELLRSRAEQGNTILVSSHVLAEVAQTVDSVLILDRGRLVTHAPLADLIAKTQQVVQIRTSAAERLQLLLTGRATQVEIVGADRLQISGMSLEEVGTLAARHGIPIFEATSSNGRLEDIFFQLTATPNEKEAIR